MLAEQIVDEVLVDLMGRKGIGDELETIRHDDEETYVEMREQLKMKVAGLLDDSGYQPGIE